MKWLILKSSLAATIIVFFWNFFSWTVLPWHNTTLSILNNEQAVAEMLRENVPAPGVYVLPSHPENMSNEQAQEVVAEKMAKGPFAFMVIHPNGMNPNMTSSLILQFLIQLLAALIATWIVIKEKNTSFLGRVAMVVLVAMFGAITCHLPHWNWWGFSTGYTLVAVADLAIGWFLAGLAIAKITA